MNASAATQQHAALIRALVSADHTAEEERESSVVILHFPNTSGGIFLCMEINHPQQFFAAMTPQLPDGLLLMASDPHEKDAMELVKEMTVEVRDKYRDLFPDPARPPVNDPLVPRSLFLVARIDSRPVACGALRPMDEEAAEVRRMYVAPSVRRKGIARRLLKALEQAASAFGYRLLRLETGKRQPEAIALYESYGFYRIPPYGCHIGDPVSICFEKSITAEERRESAVSPRLETHSSSG